MSANELLKLIITAISYTLPLAVSFAVVAPLFDERSEFHQQLKGMLSLMGYTGHPAILLLVAVTLAVVVWGWQEGWKATSKVTVAVIPHDAEKPKNDEIVEDEKPKREYRLDDDGELIEVDYEGEL